MFGRKPDGFDYSSRCGFPHVCISAFSTGVVRETRTHELGLVEDSRGMDGFSCGYPREGQPLNRFIPANRPGPIAGRYPTRRISPYSCQFWTVANLCTRRYHEQRPSAFPVDLGRAPPKPGSSTSSFFHIIVRTSPESRKPRNASLVDFFDGSLTGSTIPFTREDFVRKPELAVRSPVQSRPSHDVCSLDGGRSWRFGGEGVGKLGSKDTSYET